MSHDKMPSYRQVSLAFLCSILFLIGAVACSGNENSPPSTPLASTGTPNAEEAIGERLFLETRFAQAFKVSLDNGGNINDPNIGDSVVDTVETLGTPIDPGPFKGLSMNCRACHLVDDVLFGGTDASIPEEFQLTPEFRMAIGSATDQEVVDAVIKVVTAYVNGLLEDLHSRCGPGG